MDAGGVEGRNLLVREIGMPASEKSRRKWKHRKKMNGR